MSDPKKTVGQIAYEAYGESRMWLTVAGTPMPRWCDQKPEISEAWQAAGRAVARECLDEMAS